MRKIWKNKNVLITGFEGFVGSHLTKQLLACGANVTGLDIKTRRKETIFTGQDYKMIKVVKGSVSDSGLIGRLLKEHAIEIVFHLAAEAIVGRSMEEPVNTFITNVSGTWVVLENCRKARTVKAIVIASSDKAYGSHRDLPYTEDTPLCGEHPYDVSKSCADLISRAYFKTYGLPVAVTRCGNIYGPGDFNFSRIVPDAVRCMLSGGELLIRSDGKFTRDYIYVKDIVGAYLLLAANLAEKRFAGEGFNFSNEKPVTVRCLVEKIYKLAGKKPLYRILNKAACEIKHQYLASGKAKRLLHWKPAYSLEEGLKETISWYKRYL